MPWFQSVQTHHAAGAAFKLQPQKALKARSSIRERALRTGRVGAQRVALVGKPPARLQFESIRDYLSILV